MLEIQFLLLSSQPRSQCLSSYRPLDTGNEAAKLPRLLITQMLVFRAMVTKLDSLQSVFLSQVVFILETFFTATKTLWA